MKTKLSTLFIAALTAALLVSLPSVTSAKPLGYWTYVEHEVTIPAQTDLYHGHPAEYADHGYAQLISSTGPVGFEYYWNSTTHVLWVGIYNDNNYSVDVVFRCWFYWT